MIKDFLLALSFLTRIPVRSAHRADPMAMGRAVAFFPLVGALLAVLQIGVLHLVLFMFEDRALAVFTSVAVVVFLTGAMHLDGLADTADGLGGRTRDDALKIMRDPYLGTYGVVAVMLALGVRTAALSVLVGAESWMGPLVAILSLSRGCTGWLGWRLRYARVGLGLGRMVTEGAGSRQILVATALAVSLSLGAVGWSRALILATVAVGITLTVGRWCHVRLRGVTGDVLGANIELCELAGLLAAGFVATQS